MCRVYELVAAMFCVFGLTCEVLAIAPPYVSDEELAQYPVIVVAKWDKAPVTPHYQYRDATKTVVTKIEAYTRLKILQVVKGDVELGEHDLLMNYGISWERDGTSVTSGTSTMLSGDVDDVTKPCLWFLQRKRSWDDKRRDKYLAVGNYREVQSLELEEFFVALGGREAQTEVPELLAADTPLVSERVLAYICGGIWPWPFAGGFLHEKPSERGPLIHDEAGRVWEFLRTGAMGQRKFAASVYAELTGKAGIANIRTLLDDRDADVRGIAVGVLAHHRDTDSLDRFAKAAEGIKDATIACRVIDEIAAWKDERTVPALIGFLQNDKFAYRNDGDIGIPAIKSQQSLKAITGHEFPFDVAASAKAWEAVQSINEKSERTRRLDELAPGDHLPLAAAAVGLPTKAVSDGAQNEQRVLGRDELVVTIRLRNVSPRPVTILKDPSEVAYSWPGGSSFHVSPSRPDDADGASDDEDASGEKQLEFVTLGPGEDVELEVNVDEGFLIADPAERELSLSFLASGSGQGVKAWMGTLNVDFGADWKYRREIKQVEELWPNGNLKSVGKMVNGVKSGEWHYYNEDGDRIKIAQYGTGRGTALCNPNHPENKGAGKRPAK